MGGDVELVQNGVLNNVGDTFVVISGRSGAQRFGNTRLVRPDGLLAQEERIDVDAGNRLNLGASMHSYDEAGRLIETNVTGFQDRQRIAVSRFTYDGDLLTLEVRDSFRRDVLGWRIEHEYDDAGVPTHRTVDYLRDGVIDEEYFFDCSEDGVCQTTSFFGGLYDPPTSFVTLFDQDSVMLSQTKDEDIDGVMEQRIEVVVENDRILRYDVFGVDEQPLGRIDYLFDDEAHIREQRTFVGETLTGVRVEDFDCHFAPAPDSGACEGSDLPTDGLGCASFQPMTPMAMARLGPVVAATTQGLLVAGGSVQALGDTVMPVVDVLDPARLTGATIDLAADATAGSVGVAVGDGLLLWGGRSTAGIATSMLRIDATGVERIGPGPAAFNALAVRLRGGQVLFYGGEFDGGVFAPETPTVVTPVTNADGLANATLTPLDDGAIFIGGMGVDGTASAVARYIHPDGTTEDLIMPTVLVAHAATPTANGRVLVLGGLVSMSPTFMTDRTFFVSRVDGALRMSDGPRLPIPLIDTAPVLMPDGRILIAGGVDLDGTPSRRTFIIDDDNVLEGPPLNIPRGRATATLLDDERVAVVGGVVTELRIATAAAEVLHIGPPTPD